MNAFWIGFSCGALIGIFGLIVAVSVYLLCRKPMETSMGSTHRDRRRSVSSRPD